MQGFQDRHLTIFKLTCSKTVRDAMQRPKTSVLVRLAVAWCFKGHEFKDVSGGEFYSHSMLIKTLLLKISTLTTQSP